MDPDVPTVDNLFDEGSGWKVQIHWTVEESRMDNQKDGCKSPNVWKDLVTNVIFITIVISIR